MEMNKNKNDRHMQDLVRLLRQADQAYEKGHPIFSNYQYDALYDELVQLEKQTGVILSGSPTQQVGAVIVSELPKEAHQIPALSLEKTKSPDVLRSFLGHREGLLSWKLDGLTIVLTYENGVLEKAVTRGNGQVGEVITQNARMFSNVPLHIPYDGTLVVRGEALITYEDFERVNEELPEGVEPYKNPRNLCSGSVRQLNSQVTRDRNVQFHAFALVLPEGSLRTRKEQFDLLSYLGFTVVEHQLVTADTLSDAIRNFSDRVISVPFPSDGLVLQFNDIAYGKSLGTTAKFPRDSIAFKWQDETKETVIRKIEWSASRTGLINPVAVFDPVELEGTTVTRASVHNVSIIRGLRLSEGDTVEVYKANMIIPQIADNLTRFKDPVVPEHCPVCGAETRIRESEDGAQTLWCTNPDCIAKVLGRFTHFVSRDAMNIDGLSKETLRKWLELDLISDLDSLYTLHQRKDALCALDGFGDRLVQNILNAIEKSRKTDLWHLIYSLGIDNVGRTASKAICAHFQSDVVRTVTASKEDLLEIPDIGETIAASFVNWFHDPRHQELFENLLSCVELEKETAKTPAAPILRGLTFVITGSLNHFANRDGLKQWIEDRGGKVSGSVSAKTSYLINNDPFSTSSKNRKAQELRITILTEDELLELCAAKAE